MNPREAEAFLAKAISPEAGVWADLGVGAGTFTRALARILGAGSTIYAVDKDRRAIDALRQSGSNDGTEIIPLVGDFTRELKLPRAARGELDGILLANALHFVPAPAAVLALLLGWLRSGGNVVVVEYGGRRANRWVPYPIEPERLSEIAAAAGLAPPIISGTMPSRYSGTIVHRPVGARVSEAGMG